MVKLMRLLELLEMDLFLLGVLLHDLGHQNMAMLLHDRDLPLESRILGTLLSVLSWRDFNLSV